MGRLLPLRTETSQTPSEPRVLELNGDGADETFSALSSETARRILEAVYEEARTPTEIREEVGTSLQNVHYHLEKLEDAELVQPAGTGYSEKGNEMTVYAPSNEALVLFAGDEHTTSLLREAVGRLLGALALLAVTSLFVGYIAGSGLVGGGADGVSDAAKPTADESAKVITETTQTGVAMLDPTIAFFLGGVFALAMVGTYWYWRRV